MHCCVKSIAPGLSKVEPSKSRLSNLIKASPGTVAVSTSVTLVPSVRSAIPTVLMDPNIGKMSDNFKFTLVVDSRVASVLLGLIVVSATGTPGATVTISEHIILVA